MAELSGDRMRQMQRDAIRRVEDMQSRARQTLDRANMDLLHGGEPREREEREENGNSPRENGNSPRENGNSGGGGDGGGILSDLDAEPAVERQIVYLITDRRRHSYTDSHRAAAVHRRQG